MLILTRAGHFAATLSLGGVLVFIAIAAEPALRLARTEPHAAHDLRRRFAFVAWASLGSAFGSGMLWLVLQTQAMSGLSFSASFTDSLITTVLAQTVFGHVTATRCVIALGIAGVLIVRRRLHLGALTTWLDGVLVLLGATLSLSLAWTGHAAADEGISGIVHATADAAHLLAAMAWLGGLIPLALLLATARASDHQTWTSIARMAINRFSAIGIACVAALFITGTINTWFLVGNIPALIGTPYGRWLIVKVTLFLMMVSIALVNRFRLTPKLSHVPRGMRARASQDAIRQLTRNAYIEAGLGIAVVFIVGELGTLPPGLHMQSSWPLPFRFASELVSVSGATTAVALEASAFLVGLALMIGGLTLRRWIGSLLWPAFTIGLMMSFYSGVHLGTWIIPAYPTSFRISPTGYSVGSINNGQNTFSDNCVTCHGARGRGDGPSAKTLTIPPADLTDDHIYAHLDGDLFWWLSHGIDGAMPGFAATLDDRQLWSLIDFIHANADAIRFASAMPQPVSQFIPAPDLSAQCQDGSTVSIRELHGRIVHIVFTATASDNLLRRLKMLDLVGGDVTTILVAKQEAPIESGKFCVAQGQKIAHTYALYLGITGPSPEGAEFIIDAAGSLRAGWYPGLSHKDTDDWRRTSVIRAVVESIRRNALSPRVTTSSHVHIH